MNKIKLACLLLSLSYFSAQADVPELSTAMGINFSGIGSDSPIDGCPPLEESYFSNLFNGYDVSLQTTNLDGLAYDAATALAPYIQIALAITSYYVLKNKAPVIWSSLKQWYTESQTLQYISHGIKTISYPLRTISLQDSIGIPLFMGTAARLLQPETMGMQAILNLLPASIAPFIADQLTAANVTVSMHGGVLLFTLVNAKNILLTSFVLNCLPPLSFAIINSSIYEGPYEGHRDEDSLNPTVTEFKENLSPEFKEVLKESQKQDIDQQHVNQSEQLSPVVCINS